MDFPQFADRFGSELCFIGRGEAFEAEVSAFVRDWILLWRDGDDGIAAQCALQNVDDNVHRRHCYVINRRCCVCPVLGQESGRARTYLKGRHVGMSAALAHLNPHSSLTASMTQLARARPVRPK